MIKSLTTVVRSSSVTWLRVTCIALASAVFPGCAVEVGDSDADAGELTQAITGYHGPTESYGYTGSCANYGNPPTDLRNHPMGLGHGIWQIMNLNAYNVNHKQICANFRTDAHEKTSELRIWGSQVDRPTTGAPAAFPSIYQGCHYGVCNNAFNTPMDVPLVYRGRMTLSSMLGSFNVVVPPAQANTNFDATYDIFFTKTFNPGQSYPDGLEIMIWQAHGGTARPAGTKKGTFGPFVHGTDTYKYDVWAGQEINGTPVVTYVRTQGPANHKNLDLRRFVLDSKARWGLKPTYYLHSLQAGIEIWKGGDNLGLNGVNLSINGS